jgi:hypothetical protein
MVRAEKPLRAALAEGGDTSMLGKGDRTRTAHPAAPQQPGATGHRTRDHGGRFIAGGKKVESGVGGVARTARPGSCGT